MTAHDWAEYEREWQEFMKSEYEAVTRVLEWLIAQPSEPIKLWRPK